MPQNEITAAVRSLRKRLGDTQQQFANRLGMAISTVVRYELSRPPRGTVLCQLERVAVDNGCLHEASTFRNTFFLECGLGGVDFAPSSYPGFAPRNNREVELMQVLLWAIRRNASLLETFEKQLLPYRREWADFEEKIVSVR